MKILKEFYYLHLLNNRLEISQLDRLDLMRDFDSWIEGDNVVKLGPNQYKEHTTQWRKNFTAAELVDFYEKEFLSH